MRLGPQLMLLAPADRHAVPGLDGACTEDALDATTGIQDTGTTIDAHWKAGSDHQHVLLPLNGRRPKPFRLAVRFPGPQVEERGFFVQLAEHPGPVGLSVYPGKADVVRAAEALQGQDVSLFSSLGIGVEAAMCCRTVLRLNRPPRQPS